MVRRAVAWLFRAPEPPLTPARAVVWWEVRRIPFNIIIGSYGIACLVIFFLAIASTGRLEPGEDAVEPIALMAAPIGVNCLYTLGWLLEGTGRLLRPQLPASTGPVLLKLGLTLGVALISLPPAFWVGYRLLQLIGVVQ
jgi:hypothetical protein